MLSDHQKRQEEAFRRLEAMAVVSNNCPTNSSDAPASGKKRKLKEASEEALFMHSLSGTRCILASEEAAPCALEARVEELERECAAAKKEVREKQRYIDYLEVRASFWEECVYGSPLPAGFNPTFTPIKLE